MVKQRLRSVASVAADSDSSTQPAREMQGSRRQDRSATSTSSGVLYIIFFVIIGLPCLLMSYQLI